MRRCLAYAGMIAVAAPGMVVAAPGGDVRSISLPAQPLAASLQAIAERFGVELLFSQSVVGSRSAPPLASRMSAQQALDLVLAGTNLTARRTAEGSFLITAAPVAVSEQPEATPEILVIGRRTQNTDVRRTENDVRPYQVVTRDDVASSHVATIEELAAKKLPANDLGASFSQQGTSAQGSTASSIDLRGLGTSQTLILVDGRRLPMMPSAGAGFNQSDVNAIPPEAIERVEAITATAGGIYGPGATSGVINLVLRRDYRGADLAVTNGITERGDAPYHRVDLRLGFTPDHGSTDVMVDVARSAFGGLDVGDRDYATLATARAFANSPTYFVVGGPPPSPSLAVVSEDGSPLTLKPSSGGASLGSPITYTAPADGRSAAALVQSLIANAGKLDPTPSPNAAGAEQTLLSSRRTTSIIASIRHRSGPVELFADFLRLDNEGRARSAYLYNQTTLRADDPANPFVQSVTIYAPDPVQTISYDAHSRLTRATAGAIVDLPGSWRAEADYSRGAGERAYTSRGSDFTLAGISSYYGGAPRNPLGDYSAYLASFDGLFGANGSDYKQTNRYNDASLRLAGPILPLDGGNLTATLLLDRRNERVSGGSIVSYGPLFDSAITQSLPDYAQNTKSIYGELRAPLVDAISGFRPLRGLEVQLAVRHDDVSTQAVENALSIDGGGTRTVRSPGTVYTAGFKFSPITGVLLRGSISTGQQPLDVSDLSRLKFAGVGVTFTDPKRPGDVEEFDEISGGPPNPKPGSAQSLSAGVVFEPPSVPGLRASVDYTRIEQRGQTVVTLASGVDYFIANEATYPSRVTRLPLTAADAALGYTAGTITQVDDSSIQNGRTTVDAIDTLLDYRISLSPRASVDLHGAMTWQPHFSRYVGFGVPDRNYRGAADGAPALRANAGARWTIGSLSLSIDGQLTGSYRITSAYEFLHDVEEEFDVAEQGGARIKAQATFDLAAEYRFSMPGKGLGGRPRTLAVRFGIEDLLDTRPATVVNSYGRYNNYLDPRRRRFDLTVAVGL